MKWEYKTVRHVSPITADHMNIFHEDWELISVVKAEEKGILFFYYYFKRPK